ncbi:MAG: hypothetical protein J5693_01565 [Bacteroidales bacterium]|nr:hypothetical protein [Bacteroidales bacterium]
MKKYIVIALAAVVAFTACTKVNPEEKKSDKISFNVANYVPQTRANSSLDSEGYSKFVCNAWYFGTPMQFMNEVEVIKGDAAWAPANDYYWPKTGYINFYSYAGSKAPAFTYSDDKKTVTVKYDKTIEAADNFMVADPALHFGLANAEYNGVEIDEEQGAFNYETGKYTYSSSSQSYAGVPTLFRHKLAKVAVRVKLATTEAKKSNNTKWTVVIKANGTDTPSNLKPINKGVLTLKHTDEATAASTGTWALYADDENPLVNTSDAPNATAIGWVAGTDQETVAFKTATLEMLPTKIVSETTETILDVRTIMPQLTNGVGFNLTYEVTAQHGNETDGYEAAFMTEVIKIENKTLAAASANNPAFWGMNQVITYTITIDPVTSKVIFDPAVEEWTYATGAIALPNTSL